MLLRLSATTVWLPASTGVRSALRQPAVETSTARQIGHGEDGEWDRGAVVPAGGWSAARFSSARPVVGDVAFRVDRDVALVPPNVDFKRRPPDVELARRGPISKYLGVHRDQPGEVTVTRDEHGHQLGLHLDNWDRLLVGERHGSRNRASLNLGPEPRWLLLADLAVLSALPPDAVPSVASTRTVVGRTTEPVRLIRLQVLPGWTYIAPTENLLHDASSLGSNRGTLHASALGRFTPRPWDDREVGGSDSQLFQVRLT